MAYLKRRKLRREFQFILDRIKSDVQLEVDRITLRMTYDVDAVPIDTQSILANL